MQLEDYFDFEKFDTNVGPVIICATKRRSTATSNAVVRRKK